MNRLLLLLMAPIIGPLLLTTNLARAEMSGWGHKACIGDACCGESWFDTEGGTPFCGGSPTSGITCTDFTSLTVGGERVDHSDARIIVAVLCGRSGWLLSDWSSTDEEGGIGAGASCPEGESLNDRMCIVYVPD